jgi:Galactose oxidase, central domain
MCDVIFSARSFHTATLLRSGEVLVAGGTGPTATAELYDPARGKWSSTASPNTARYYHTATRLRNGSVLVAGGFAGGIAVLTSRIVSTVAFSSHDRHSRRQVSQPTPRRRPSPLPRPFRGPDSVVATRIGNPLCILFRVVRRRGPWPSEQMLPTPRPVCRCRWQSRSYSPQSR